MCYCNAIRFVLNVDKNESECETSDIIDISIWDTSYYNHGIKELKTIVRIIIVYLKLRHLKILGTLKR